MVTHARGNTLLGITLLSGITAVQGFYVISGFLVTMILNERREYDKARTFYLSRYLRLWPAYMVIVIMSVTIQPYLFFTALPREGWQAATFVTFTNATLLLQDWTLFLEVDRASSALVPTAHFGAGAAPQLNNFLAVPQAWTLGVELTFYLIAPFLCRRMSGVVALFVFGLGIRIVMGFFLPPAADPWQYRFAPAEMMLFAAGGLAYFSGKALNDWMQVPRIVWRIAGAVAVILIGVAVFGNGALTQTSARYASLGWWTQSIYLMDVAFITMVVLVCPILFYATKGLRWDRLLGELSYPMYICHTVVPPLAIAASVDIWASGNAVYVGLVLASSAALLAAVVLPIDRFRHRIARSATDMPPRGFVRQRELAGTQ